MPDQVSFVASTTNITSVCSLITSIAPFGDTFYLTITQDGLSFSVVCNNVCKVVLTLDVRLFSDYELDSSKQRIVLSLNLKSLLETINLHLPVGDKESPEMRTKCTFSYKEPGSPFVLIFEDDLIVERCELLTFFIEPEVEENLDSSAFELDSSQLIFETVLKSTIICDAFKDMDDLNTDEFILYCSSREEHKQLIFISRSKDSSIGYSKLIVPEKKALLKDLTIYDPINSTGDSAVACDASVSSFYHFNYFAKIIRAIRLSKLIKIRKDVNGLTSFLALIGPTKGSSQLFYGTSIKFVTLESVPMDERILTSSNEVPTAASELGYNNPEVERMIRDEENIQVVRISDGQLTLDDYFQPQEFVQQSEMPPPPVGHLHGSLRVTEELTRSVLGLTKQAAAKFDEDIDVNRTEETPLVKNTKRRKKQSKKKKKDGEGIETVGGAIEIPLFI